MTEETPWRKTENASSLAQPHPIFPNNGTPRRPLSLTYFWLQELGIKHPLHKKKLQLALQALGSEEEDAKDKLDYNWVTSKLLWIIGQMYFFLFYFF